MLDREDTQGAEKETNLRAPSQMAVGGEKRLPEEVVFNWGSECGAAGQQGVSIPGGGGTASTKADRWGNLYKGISCLNLGQEDETPLCI